MTATSSPVSEELSTDLMLTNITGNTGYILEYWKYGKIWVLIISKVPRLLNNSIFLCLCSHIVTLVSFIYRWVGMAPPYYGGK